MQRRWTASDVGNPSYTNIMIETHADAVISDAINNGYQKLRYRIGIRGDEKDA